MDWSETALKRADISPKRRLEKLFERSNTTHVDNSIEVRRYFDIAGEMLKSAKKFETSGRHEDALRAYLRYRSLIKKLSSHKRYRDIPIGERAAFDYKLKKVANQIKDLSEIVLSEYKRFYNMVDFNMQTKDLDGYQEQRPTVSTVRTFISTPRTSELHPPSLQRISSASRHRYRTLSGQSGTSSMMKSIASLTAENLQGIRRSIFPMKQVKEFDEIHRQRRIVRSHRTVVLPSRITTLFASHSFENTRMNVETVGYLAGKEVNANELVVTHLIFPEQLGYSDYFRVYESMKLIRFLEANDLLTLGWIHSHPMERCYLTSCDMHYQGIFQSVLPEAIAMVYSPIDMESKAFNLTPNNGLKAITNCREKGFHIHRCDSPLSMESQHAVTDLFGDLIVKDFRVQSRPTLDRASLRYSAFGYSDLFERMLQAKFSSSKVTPASSKVRQSEVDFVHLSPRPTNTRTSMVD